MLEEEEKDINETRMEIQGGKLNKEAHNRKWVKNQTEEKINAVRYLKRTQCNGKKLLERKNKHRKSKLQNMDLHKTQKKTIKRVKQKRHFYDLSQK